MITISEQEYDDMRRCIGVIALSGTPNVQGGYNYTVHGHRLSVEHCQAVMRQYRHDTIQATTTDIHNLIP